MALIFTGIHVGTILLDTYVHFSVADVLIPFASSWHPLAVALGVVALYVLLAVELTSLARARISKRLWRGVHFGGFGLFVLSTMHALTAGTDRTEPAFLLAVISTCIVVGVLTGIRVARARPRRPPAASVRVPVSA
jgi:predicted ferric reductase